MAISFKKDAGLSSAPIPSDCLPTDSIGDFVYVTSDRISGKLQVSKVDIADPAKMPAFGIIVAKVSSTECFVQTSGIVLDVYSGLTPKSVLFVGADSRAAETPPEPGVGETYLIQTAGYSISSNEFCLDLAKIPIKRAN